MFSNKFCIFSPPDTVSYHAKNQKDKLGDKISESDRLRPFTVLKPVHAIFLLSAGKRIISLLEDQFISNDKPYGGKTHHETECISKSALTIFFIAESSHRNEVGSKSKAIKCKDAHQEALLLSITLKVPHTSSR